MSIFIIAEAGVNHNGDISIAKELVNAAAGAGTDAVKFQTFKADRIAARSAPKADYQAKNTNTDESQYEMLERLELSESAHKELFAYCNGKDIMFMSTPFDESGADMLDNMGMEIFKIPSGEITNKDLIKHIASKKKPVIMSTGMSDLEEVEKAVGWINDIWGTDRQQLTLLHCVSNYPASFSDLNLRAIETMKNTFSLPAGFSDHTKGIEASIAAAALGAAVIEKHFTLDRTMEGPDHRASIEPNELRQMVNSIRNIELAMGDGIKRPVANEEPIRNVARKCLVAARTINAGAVISAGDIAVKRPGTGIPPEFKADIIGMKAIRKIEPDSIIKREEITDA